MSITKTRRGHAASVVPSQGGQWTVHIEHRGMRGSMTLLTRMMSANPDELVRITESGIPAKFVVYMAEMFARRPSQFAPLIGLSRSTLDRKLRQGDTLDFIGGDRAVRFTRLWKQALDVWESDEAAREWLNTPNPHLGGVTPFDRAATEVGNRQVEDLLGQIAHGVLP